MHHNKRFIKFCYCNVGMWYLLAEQRYVFECGRDGVMFMCAHVDMVLCGNSQHSKKRDFWSLTGWPPLISSFAKPFEVPAKTLS